MVNYKRHKRKHSKILLRGNKYWSVAAISKRYSFHPNTIRSWVNVDKLRHIRRGPGGKIYIQQDVVEQFIYDWYEERIEHSNISLGVIK